LNEKDTMYLEGFVAFAGTGDEIAGAPVLRRIQIMPRGQAKIRDGRKCLITQSDIDSVMAYYEEQANEVAFLVNHGEDAKYGGEAVGWIKKLEQDAIGVFAYVEWDPEITPKIRSKKLRYVSPGFKYKLDSAGNMRPVYLREASLTNVPAIDHMQEAVATEGEAITTKLTETRSVQIGANEGRLDTSTSLCDAHKSSMFDLTGNIKSCAACQGKPDFADPIEKENQMDEKTVAALKEKQDALETQFAAFTESITKTFTKMAEDIEAKIMPGLKASAEKHADAKLAEQRSEDAYTAILDAATAEGRLTAAQRDTFTELTAGNHKPEAAAKFIATLPITAPVGSKLKAAADPDLTTKTESRVEFMDRVVKYADKFNTTIIAAEMILGAEKK
jgi:phage I-like protein